MAKVVPWAVLNSFTARLSPSISFKIQHAGYGMCVFALKRVVLDYCPADKGCDIEDFVIQLKGSFAVASKHNAVYSRRK